MTNDINMTKGRPLRLMVTFALPLMLGNAFQQFYTVTDTAIVGRGVGLDALAALGTVDWLTWMMLGVAQGLTQGFSVPMAMQYGKGDHEELRRTVGYSVRLSALIALICLVLSEGLLPLFLRFLRVPAELTRMASLYAGIIFGGIPAIVFYNLTASILRAVGDSRTPLAAMIVASVLNIGLDLLTVFVFHWGIAGAAGATVLSQLLSGVICAYKIGKSPSLRFGKEDVTRRDPSLRKSLLGCGIPIALQNTIIAVGGITIQSVVNGFSIGFIAGFTATNKLYGILEICALSCGCAVMTFVGQNYGAALPERIKKGVRSALFLALLTSVVIGGLMIAVGRPLTAFFIEAEDPLVAAAAADTAYRYLFTMSVCLPVLYLIFVYRSALEGMGNTMIPLLSSVFELFLRVGVALYIGSIGKENAIFLAEVSAWFSSAVILAAAYYISAAKLGTKGKRIPEDESE